MSKRFLLAIIFSGLPLGAQTPVETSIAVHQDLSKPMTVIGKIDQETAKQERIKHPLPPKAYRSPSEDPALQINPGNQFAPAMSNNFDGVGQGAYGFTVTYAPPDTNGAAGATQYVQWVNASYAVFDKVTGTLQFGPVSGKSIWSGFGGGCELNNDGDPILQYDKAANRWIFSQFSVKTQPYLQCFAISTTSDATGAYYRYSFPMPNFPDYPKITVWPDAYYASFNMFKGNTFLGARSCAFDRINMLAGAPATSQCFQLNANYGGLLPSDLDGSTPPPAGSPNFFLAYGTNSLYLWKFHADFTNPANSTFSGPAAIPVAAFTPACLGGTCIPQPNTTQQLDSLGDRLMYRLAYRNFGDHEALTVNHSISAGTATGVRWYEIRTPNSAPTLYQQGTFAPDSNFRWMGSIGQDKNGDIAMGYSVSSTTVYPSIRYTGRAPADPLGTMQIETGIIDGAGSQLPNLNRWGDYSSMSIDPVDDCTFWYTNQYLQSSGTYNWNTRIANFKFPGCNSNTSADFSASAAPASQTVNAGAPAISYSVTVTPAGGFNSPVAFGVSGLPPGATASFSPSSLTGIGSSTLKIATTTATPAGTFPLTITATGGSAVHTAFVSLTVINSTPPSGTAAFVAMDTATQGNWRSAYGSDGYTVVNDSTNYPAYAQVVVTGESNYTWAASTTDVRALQKRAPATDRIAATWFAPSPFTIDINFTDGQTHQVSLFLLDWDSGGRAETVDILDANTGALFDSRPVSSFANGKYLVWNLSGHVKARVTRTGSSNAVVSGLFFGGSAALPAGAATFVTTDNATQGNWKAGYGADGYTVVNDSANYPAYAQVTIAGQSNYTWVSSSTDVRALQKAAASDRIAATWYTPTNFILDINLTDGKTHQVSLYCLDWDSAGRAETIDILDAATNAILDSRPVSSFDNGKYLVWNLSGHVKARVSVSGGSNAVVSGLFFGGANSVPPNSAIFLKADAATQGNWRTAYGKDGYAVVNDSTSYPAYAKVSLSGASSYTWASSTTDIRALQRAAAADRIASTWYGYDNFVIDINLTDGKAHQVSLYCLDWEPANRSQRIDILDASTNALLDSQTVSSFGSGKYLVWTILGHVRARVTLTAASNAVVSGLFFN
ncbi:MAG: hypothetical protein M3Z09_02910 [Acidobacteriota bacterium]|nr:hypothetical protein [Acidobacteriota bacterium]